MEEIKETKQFNSAEHWEQRYAAGRNSGAGSYIESLRNFKNDILIQVIRWKKITSIIDWGCGDGHQLSDLPFKGEYLGIDVSRTAIEKCTALYDLKPNFKFMVAEEYRGQQAKLGLSLDVIYHLVEDSVFEAYMNRLFDSSLKFVLIYSSNSRKVEFPAIHIKERTFTDWIEANRSQWELETTFKNSFPYKGGKSSVESISDFYLFKNNG